MIIILCWTDDDLERLKLRDPIVFKKVYNRYKDKVYKFLLIKTKGNIDFTNDVFSTTFQSALESAPKMINTNNLLSWLLQIAHRRMADQLRKAYTEDKFLGKLYEENDEKDPFESVNSKEPLYCIGPGNWY